MNSTNKSVFWEMLNTQKGNSLIQVMVAAAIVGIVALGLSTMIINNQNAMSVIEAKSDLINVGNQIRFDYSIPTKCQSSLITANAPVNLTPSGGTFANKNLNSMVSPIDGATVTAGSIGSSIIPKTALSFDGFTITNYTLVSSDPCGADTCNQYRAVMNFKSSAKTGLVFKEEPISILLTVNMTGNNVTACQTETGAPSGGGGGIAGIAIEMRDCRWSPSRYYGADQSSTCVSYYGEDYVMTNYDCQKSHDYCRYNRIQCCRISAVPLQEPFSVVTGSWSACFVDCDATSGVQTRSVKCVDANGRNVDLSYCDSVPSSTQTCTGSPDPSCYVPPGPPCPTCFEP